MKQEATKVLVVEDDPLFTKLVTSMLLAKGFQVLGVASAEAGLDALKSEVFDVLITDLKMEGLGGVGLIRTIMAEQLFPIARILVITGEPANSEDSRWVVQQSIPVLRKPFSLRALLDAMDARIQA